MCVCTLCIVCSLHVMYFILTVMCCWLHICFPQAAVRAQKGEKGEHAVLEPVSDHFRFRLQATSC